MAAGRGLTPHRPRVSRPSPGSRHGHTLTGAEREVCHAAGTRRPSRVEYDVYHARVHVSPDPPVALRAQMRQPLRNGRGRCKSAVLHDEPSEHRRGHPLPRLRAHLVSAVGQGPERAMLLLGREVLRDRQTPAMRDQSWRSADSTAWSSVSSRPVARARSNAGPAALRIPVSHTPRCRRQPPSGATASCASIAPQRRPARSRIWVGDHQRLAGAPLRLLDATGPQRERSQLRQYPAFPPVNGAFAGERRALGDRFTVAQGNALTAA
jgi:hypothetical protein